MRITVIYPRNAHSAYKIAAEAFAELAKQTAEADLQLLTDDCCREDGADLTVLIGNDAVNSVTAMWYLSKQTDAFGIRYGTDDYAIRCVELAGRRVLFLAGGRPRSTIYAVYRYFERFCGCRWFWDGDRIPKTQLPLADADLVESPRFDYRGLRYFAHRSLHRFQAEHWTMEDWATEIDWILKKRMNLFMLRIGMDDVFQKAFPDIVPYYDRDLPLPGNGTGYNDRNLFWSLEYRGQLRKKILDYAFERDLMHPEDCGTVSHWYSRTPQEFLDTVQPELLPQVNTHYNDPTGRVWDIRRQENFDNYFKLTEAHVREYGKPELFHTIGLGERMYSDDPEENMRMKLYVYRKIATRVKEEYPNAPLLIASWDLWQRFTPEEVQALVAELDPSQSIILDYTSDSVRTNNFTRWGLMNKFPWIFGVFSAYEPESEIRGFYELTNQRLRLAKADPLCKGVVFWPELSHGDSLAIEYCAQNAWDGETPEVGEQVDRYCRDRYPAEILPDMLRLWQTFMPIVELTAWNVSESHRHNGEDYFTKILRKAPFSKEERELYQSRLAVCAPHKEAAIRVLRQLSALTATDELTRRDFCDIARTVLGRFINILIIRAEYLFAAEAPLAKLEKAMDACEAMLELLSQLLATHEDYSLLASLRRLQAAAETNPNFEETLKNNAECNYNRSYIYENTAYLYLPEMKILFSHVKQAVKNNGSLDTDAIAAAAEENRKRYFATPLEKMQTAPASFREIVSRAAQILEETAL